MHTETINQLENHWEVNFSSEQRQALNARLMRVSTEICFDSRHPYINGLYTLEPWCYDENLINFILLEKEHVWLLTDPMEECIRDFAWLCIGHGMGFKKEWIKSIQGKISGRNYSNLTVSAAGNDCTCRDIWLTDRSFKELEFLVKYSDFDC